MLLKAYASDSRASRGRKYAEPAQRHHAEDRNAFQRDRDRIVHRELASFLALYAEFTGPP